MPDRVGNSRFYDLHVHSEFSCDAKSTMETMCRQALSLGLHQIAFTDHVDYVPADIGYGFFRPQAYEDQIERCRDLFGDSLTVLSGVEIGEFHRFQRQAEALLADGAFDMVIGSLHWMDDEYLGQSGYYRRRSVEQAWWDYLDELERMVRRGGFDILGHLDIIRRYGGERFGRGDMIPCEDGIRAVLEALVDRGIALEINTASLRTWLGLTNPDAVVVGWYREMGGELLTIGSDAHTASDIGSGWEVAADLVRAAGFTHLTTYRNRTPHQIPLENV